MTTGSKAGGTREEEGMGTHSPESNASGGGNTENSYQRR